MTDVIGVGDLLRFVLALVFVVGLIGLLALLFKRYGGGLAFGGGPGGIRRLSIREALAVDARHRLVLVRRDGKEHLLLLGPQGAVVVESGIDARDAIEKITQDNQGPQTDRPAPASRFQHLLGGITAKRDGKGGQGPDKG